MTVESISLAEYRGIIFDLFGTLVDIFHVDAHDRMAARMADALGAPPDDFIRLWVATFPERSLNVFPTTEANILHVTSELGITPSQQQISYARKIRWDFTRESLHPKSETLPLLQAARDAGLRIGLISDCSCEVPELWDSTPMAPFFTTALFSCTEGICKPDRRIYLSACSRLDLDPTECLYVGDGGSRELSGADAVGMTPILLYEQEMVGDHVYRARAEEWEGLRIEALGELTERIGTG